MKDEVTVEESKMLVDGWVHNFYEFSIIMSLHSSTSGFHNWSGARRTTLFQNLIACCVVCPSTHICLSPSH
jgi:hypothetical protein